VIGRLGVLLVPVLLVASCVQAQDTRTRAEQGAAVFRQQGCYGCHTVGVTGTPIATNLTHIGSKHDQEYFTRWLRDPSMQRPTAHMPKIDLSESEIRDLAAYLGSLR